MKTSNILKTEPNETEALAGRLLRHPARKRYRTGSRRRRTKWKNCVACGVYQYNIHNCEMNAFFITTRRNKNLETANVPQQVALLSQTGRAMLRVCQ